MKTLNLALGVAVALALLPDPGGAQDMAAVAEGAKLYGQNCVRCHSARSPTERTDREWVTIVNHMRARANMRKSEAQAMIAYLQATNLPETSGTATASASPTQDASPAPTGTTSAAEADASPATATVDEPLPGSGDVAGKEGPPLLVVVDLADPELAPDARAAVERYLEALRNP